MKNLRDELKKKAFKAYPHNEEHDPLVVNLTDVLELLDQWEKEQDVNIKTVEAYKSGIKSVLNEMEEKIKGMPKEFQEIVNKHFWDLI